MPFMCEYCGAVFKREREVVYHEWRHTGTPKGAVKEASPASDVGATYDKPHKHGCGCQHRGGENGSTDGQAG